MSNERVWSLYNIERGSQFDGLTSAEARAIVMVLAHEERAHWLGVRFGWKEWKPIKNCLGLMSSAGMSHTSVGYVTPKLPIAKLPTKKKRSSEKSSEETTEEEVLEVTLTDTNVRELDEQNRRKFKRVEIKLVAEIICQEQSYETYTTDVSVGGIAVEGCLPDWIAGYCTVVLTSPGHEQKLEFMCSVVENQKGKNYRLELHPSVDTRELELWLEEGVPLQKAE